MMGKKDIITIEIEQAEAERLADLEKTKRIKQKFISDLKNGLGNEIKNNPNRVIIHKDKTSIFKKILNSFKKIFTRF